MTKTIFRGQARYEGRFGHVKPGDMLVLTDKEWACVRHDPDFKQVDDDYRQPAPQSADDVNRASRLAQVAALTPAAEVQQMSLEELLATAEGLASVDPGFKVPPRPSKAELIRLLLARGAMQKVNPI